MIATPQPRLAVFVRNNLLHCWNSITIFFPSHLKWTRIAANVETERELQLLFSASRIAFALVCLCKVEILDKSLPWGKNMGKKGQS